MAKKQALGKGLDALMGGMEGGSMPGSGAAAGERASVAGSALDYLEQKAGSAGAAQEIPIDSIDANPYQPRIEFNQEELEELASSIRELGIIQPLVLRASTGGRYELIVGERRLRAAKLVGLGTVPAHVREADEQAMRIIALVENVQRADLNAIEVAESYQQIAEACDLSHEEIANYVGKSRTSVTNHLRLLKLPEAVQEALRSKRISMGHARTLLGLDEPKEQIQLMQITELKGLSVRELERLVKQRQDELAKLQDTDGAAATKKAEAPAIDENTLKQLQTRLGWGVTVSSNDKGAGKIVLSFRSNDERDALLEKLLSIEES